MWEHASFNDKVSFVVGGFVLVMAAIIGIGYLTGNVDGPAPARVVEEIDYEQQYRDCMASIEGYLDDGGDRWERAAEACSMIGSSEGRLP